MFLILPVVAELLWKGEVYATDQITENWCKLITEQVFRPSLDRFH